jgi:hypothetical protein
MTSATSSAPPIDRRDLINAILELPEKDFLDLVDIRLNRPKGLRIQGQEYVEIILILILIMISNQNVVQRMQHLNIYDNK